jgi:hypothetical protein
LLNLPAFPSVKLKRFGLTNASNQITIALEIFDKVAAMGIGEIKEIHVIDVIPKVQDAVQTLEIFADDSDIGFRESGSPGDVIINFCAITRKTGGWLGK